MKVVVPIVDEPEKKKAKLSYKEKVEFEGLENEIERLGDLRNELTEKLNSGNLDGNLASKIAMELNLVALDIDKKEQRWLELAELA